MTFPQLTREAVSPIKVHRKTCKPFKTGPVPKNGCNCQSSKANNASWEKTSSSGKGKEEEDTSRNKPRALLADLDGRDKCPKKHQKELALSKTVKTFL